MKHRDTPLAWAEALLRRHRRFALRYFTDSALRVERKADDSPVTIADRLLEERFRRAIERAFPGEGVLGEEFGRTRPDAATYWTVDPIDGTRAFSRGLPSWGMMLARVERGVPTLGACDYPATDTFIGVERGTPAYERAGGQRRWLPRARPVRALSEAVIFHGGSRWWLPTPYAAGMARLLHDCYLERSYGDCYAYLWVLRGRADAAIDYGVKPWDMAPFAVFARSTGRVLSDFDGAASFDGPDSIFAHPSLQRVIVRRLRRARRPIDAKAGIR